MQKRLQKKQKLNYSAEVMDIVLFGSAVFEDSNANDLDIAVIFKSGKLKQQLEEAQKIKKQLVKKYTLPIHIQSYNLYSLFDKGNFARESILFSGKSLIYGKYFVEIFGLVPKVQISYSLKKLEKKDKVRFNYILNGKKKEYGLLRKYGGKLLGPGLIEINPEYEMVFVSAMKSITSDIKIKRVLVSK